MEKMKSKELYICPMHPEISQGKKGFCSLCGMELIRSDQTQNNSPEIHKEQKTSYLPLFVIFALLLLTTIVLAIHAYIRGQFLLSDGMSNFMAGFFLVFSGFKLLDLPGFKDGYQTYDLIAQKIPFYGYIYPFLELNLGLLYAIHFTPSFVLIATFLLMSLSGIGVLQKLIKHEKFQCACLGTLLKLPLTKVTLFEDFGMAAMALLMLFVR